MTNNTNITKIQKTIRAMYGYLIQLNDALEEAIQPAYETAKKTAPKTTAKKAETKTTILQKSIDFHLLLCYTNIKL